MAFCALPTCDRGRQVLIVRARSTAQRGTAVLRRRAAGEIGRRPMAFPGAAQLGTHPGKATSRPASHDQAHDGERERAPVHGRRGMEQVPRTFSTRCRYRKGRRAGTRRPASLPGPERLLMPARSRQGATDAAVATGETAFHSTQGDDVESSHSRKHSAAAITAYHLEAALPEGSRPYAGGSPISDSLRRVSLRDTLDP